MLTEGWVTPRLCAARDTLRERILSGLDEAKRNGVKLGRPEGSGCYCFANDLLSECMGELERDYHFIVIDTDDVLLICRVTMPTDHRLQDIPDPNRC